MPSFTTSGGNSNLSHIAIRKQECKEYRTSDYPRTVYLKNGDEFQLEIFNPKTTRIGVDIHINGESLGSVLVVRPGERIWLDRFFRVAKKFTFGTYEVESGNAAVDAAIGLNGEVSVYFYDEKPTPKEPVYPIYEIKTTPYTRPFEYWTSENHIKTPNFGTQHVYSSSVGRATMDATVEPSDAVMGCNYCQTITTSCADEGINFTTSTVKDTAASSHSTKETGRVEEGSASHQKFRNTSVEFNTYPYLVETIKILPVSQKPVTSSELSKRYCPQCGRKVKSQFKFCPGCGAKLD